MYVQVDLSSPRDRGTRGRTGHWLTVCYAHGYRHICECVSEISIVRTQTVSLWFMQNTVIGELAYRLASQHYSGGAIRRYQLDQLTKSRSCLQICSHPIIY